MKTQKSKARKSSQAKPGAKSKKGSQKNKKIIGWMIGGCAALLLLAYIGVAFFFTTHFFINTEINGHDFSMKTAVDVENFFKSQMTSYILTVNEKDGKKDTIKGSDISLVYKESKEIENVLKSQNAFLWPQSVFSKKSADITIDLSYDEAKLEQAVQSLEAVKVEQIPAQSACPKFDGNQFVVQEEIYGTAVDMEVLREKIVAAVNRLDSEIDLEEKNCYAVPEYTSDSEEVKQACEEMNRYCQASITYTMDVPVVIDKTVISTWVSVDEGMKVTLDENAVKKWLEEFGDKYDTVGTTRSFTTPTGKSTTVTGGTYGWSIDEDTEFTAILNAVKGGETVTKEPAYYIGGTAASHGTPDWGNTYAEVDLSQQHMWYISNGAIALETDVVTGEPIPERITPEGVYYLLNKTPNETLVGNLMPDTGEPEYRTFVYYWMPITWEGVGFHDATWQTAFGGSLNQIHGVGSHGCVNMPLDQAAALYDMIEVGTPVVIHY